jgi:transketolase
MRFNARDLKYMSGSVKALALHAIHAAASGHVGIVMSVSNVVTTIYANFLRPGLDRFVLSAGHGSAMLYAVLKLAGYDVGDLETFRKIGGLPGHPEIGIDGIDATTGPLGQGVANAVGLAIAEKIKGTGARVYCLCSDGDLSEGVAFEAISFAGRYKLDNLVLLWDDNGLTIDGAALTTNDVPGVLRAAGWRVVNNVDVDDFDRLNRALADSKRSSFPTFIQVKSVLGAGTSLAGKSSAHGLAIESAELLKLMRQYVSGSGEARWAQVAAGTVKHKSQIAHTIVPNPVFKNDETNASTRELSAQYLNLLFANGLNLIGGSADLGSNTGARVEKSKMIVADDFSGNYINYGVREHAMGAIMNGMTAGGVRAYGSTFLVFADYMRPSIRIAAMSGLPVVYVFSHDSVAVGEDGPTHQPVEQLASLRLIPNLNVFRPANKTEVAWAWQTALNDVMRPSAIILSRQKFLQIATPSGTDLSNGAYVIYPATARRVRITIIATGADVPFAVAVAKKIGPSVQVVSMPSVEKFRGISQKFQRDILRGFVVAIESGASAPWFEFADAVCGIDRFGMSGDGQSVLRAMGMDVDMVAADICKKMK